MRLITVLAQTFISKMPAPNCIFCKIVAGELPASIIYEDEEIIIFKDIKPAATHHYLACPKRHIKDIQVLTKSDIPLVETLMKKGKEVLEENGGNLEDLITGFHRPPFNSINHLHLHLISAASEMSYLNSIIFKKDTWWFIDVDFVLECLKLKLKL